jgi:hypothetical protein
VGPASFRTGTWGFRKSISLHPSPRLPGLPTPPPAGLASTEEGWPSSQSCLDLVEVNLVLKLGMVPSSPTEPLASGPEGCPPPFQVTSSTKSSLSSGNALPCAVCTCSVPGTVPGAGASREEHTRPATGYGQREESPIKHKEVEDI